MLGFLRHPNLHSLAIFVGWGEARTPTQSTFEDSEQILKLGLRGLKR